jgi:asparagine synthase (glutamine-hydrolysing)
MMCGFVGFCGTNQSIDNESVITNMMNTIIHRGPDSGEFYTDEKVTLGFRRLKIIDLSEEANQPMYNEDGSIILVFNGEIYNFQELREDLISKGHIFKSNTDSEVIIHSYEEYGVELLNNVRGMFAFCIWDKKNDEMFLARDFFGIKPLYYSQNTNDNTFIFGSEIKSFLEHPSFNKELNKDSLRAYLTFQYSSLDETFFKGVYKLKPGHYLIYKNGKTTINSYWDAKFNVEEESLESYIEKIKSTFRESVKYHKISDVKVGAFLSGGIDSSYVTTVMMPNNTFSVGFSDYEEMFDETNLAEELSGILGIDNHKKLISADECFDLLPKIQYHMDEPQSNPSAVPLFFLAELASKHVTVTLSGEGADEMFAGYLWYQKSKNLLLYEKIPFSLRRMVSNISKNLPKNKVTNFLIKGGQTIEEKFIGEAIVFKEAEAMEVLKDDYRKGPSVSSITKKVYDEIPNADDTTKMQYLDMNLWLPGDILLKADKMSMAHSLELRVPFLDKEVMELAKKIPSKYRVNLEDTKYVLRRAANEVLPDEWANRKKLGFPVPIRHWLKDEKYYNMVKKEFESDIASEFFHKDVLLRYLDEHYENKANRGRYIWTVYVFLVWYKEFFVKR